MNDQIITSIPNNSKFEDKEERKVVRIRASDSSKKNYRIKLDYGFKALLRGIRHCLKGRMERSPMFTGRHHWTNEKLFKVTKVVISKEFGFKNPTDYETWVLVLLLNPVKGILESKKTNTF